MSHICGHPLPDGGECSHMIADPQHPDCGRHPSGTPHGRAVANAPFDKRGCRMQEHVPGTWRCLVHDPGSPEWKTAIAMGAQLPCRIPGAAGYRERLARGGKLDPQTAVMLAQDPNEWVRRWVAGSATTSPPDLERLVQDPDVIVRRWVADNRATPPRVLERMAQDLDAGVRYRVAIHPTTPPQVLESLAQDPDSSVRREVARRRRSVFRRWSNWRGISRAVRRRPKL